MSLETGSYINSLVATNPLAGDPRSEGDDHIRLLKAVLLATFPNLTGAVTPTQAELNRLAGITSGVQAQLDALTAAKAPMEAGVKVLFFMPNAPLGWTQDTSHHNKALRVVSGTGAAFSGTVDFTAAFTSQAVNGSVANHNLTEAEMPIHKHKSGTGTQGHGGTGDVLVVGNGAPLTTDTTTAGSGQGHNHDFTGTAINLAVKYIDVILASRNAP